jgi:lipopolysaccharide transport system ATP-binding protein
LFISHDLTTVERLCDTAVLLEGGAIAATGSPSEVVASYHRRLSFDESAPGPTAANSIKSGVALTNVTLCNPSDPQSVSFRAGAPLAVSVRYVATRSLSNVEFELRYYSADGTTLIAAPRTGERPEPLNLRPPGGVLEFSCAALTLKPGAYYVGAVVRDRTSFKILAWWDGETRLYVDTGPATEGQFYIPHTWRLTHADQTNS